MIRKQFPELYYFAPSIIVGKRDSYYYAIKYKDKYPFVKSSDASTVVNEAIDAISYGKILLGVGVYELSEPIDLTGKHNIVLEGEHYGVVRLDGSYSYGTVLYLKDGVNDDIIKKDESTADRYGIVIRNLLLYGNRDNQTSGRGVYIRNCKETVLENLQVWNCYGWGIELRDSEVSWIRNCEVRECGAGINIVSTNVKAIGCDIGRTYTSHCLYIGSVKNVKLVKCNAYLSQLTGIYVDGGEEIDIIGCSAWSNDQYGCRIRSARNVRVIGGDYKNNSQESAGSYAGILIEDSEYVRVMGVSAFDDQATATQGYGIREYGTSDNNVIAYCTVYGNSTAQIERVGSSTIVRRNIGYRTVNSGVATFSGDGSTTEFRIEHGLVSTPSKYGVSPLTPDAHADKTITVDSTYIIITFSTAPPSGTDNLKFGWWAEV